jgi:hypothetical protein
VRSLSLVKFKTPMFCKGAGGILSQKNDAHWGVLINNTTLVHLTVLRDQPVIQEDEWNPQPNSPTPCRAYCFNDVKQISIDSSQLLKIPDFNCHKICKAIFKLLGIDIMVMFFVLHHEFE